MPNHCTVSILGHLGGDPEVRTIPSGQQVCNVNIAYTPYGTNRDGVKKDTIWFTLTVWGKQAERFASWFKKGDVVLAHGELDQESWTGKEGEARSRLVIKVSSFSGVGKGKDEDAPPPAKRTAKAKQQAQDDDTSSDVPF